MDLASIILRVRAGDRDGYSEIVRRFQDMAVGYAYAIMHDFQLAEDAAQEAFLEAYRDLPKLREPAAFPGWFRRIVFKHCDRILRSSDEVSVAISEVSEPSLVAPSQAEAMEQDEMRNRVLDAVDTLPDHERETIMLFYFAGYSHKEACAFLDVPLTTVKKRLNSARGRLRDKLLDIAESSLRDRRPSLKPAFAGGVMEILKAATAGDVVVVKQLLERDPRLVTTRDPMGNTALTLAVNSGHLAVAELLYAAGVEPGIHESAAVGLTDRVSDLLRDDPALLDSYSPEGFTPLSLAAHFGHLQTARLLLSQGAELDRVSRHAIGVTPLHAALFGRKEQMAQFLINSGAALNLKRGGHGWPRAGWTALHYAAGFGFATLVQTLLDKGAEPDLKDDSGKTPRDVALEEKHPNIAHLLTGRKHDHLQ